MVGKQCVQLKLTSTASGYLCSGKMMESLKNSQSGQTLQHSTGDPGLDAWISSQAASPARTSALQEKERGLLEKEVACGEKWPELLAKFDPITCLWKIPQISLFEEGQESLETLPIWGTAVGGELWALTMSAHLTGATESGLFPTPTACQAPNLNSNVKCRPKNLLEAAQHNWSPGKMWPTPTVCGNHNRKGLSKTSGDGLATAVAKSMGKTWPTPTPTAHNAKECAAPSEYLRNTPTLAAQAGGKLNPEWVELLMGWPKNHTCLDPISHIEYIFWLMGNCDEETREQEILRVLRRGYAAKEIQRKIGRPVSIQEAAFLLSLVCEYKKKTNEARVFMACEEALKKQMRGLRIQQKITSASYRSRYYKQRRKKHTNTMQALSRLLAHYGKEAWQDGSWENAVPRVSNGVADRSHRLKAIGNGQVPGAVRLAWEILK